jgi:hypothetical protein
LGIATPITQATILSNVGTPSPTSPSANGKVTTSITIFSLHSRTQCIAEKINDNISKKFQSNDKIMESLAAQMESINSVIKNQLSFNKMIETQVA